MKKDVTKKVSFHSPDDEHLPITKCVCGATFSLWDFSISIYEDIPIPCPVCKRKLYFKNNIVVYEIKEE